MIEGTDAEGPKYNTCCMYVKRFIGIAIINNMIFRSDVKQKMWTWLSAFTSIYMTKKTF